MKKRKSKHGFTLFEVMVCLVIIGLLTGILGVKIASLVDMYRFRLSAQKLLFEIEHWQILAITHKEDIVLNFTKEGGEYVYTVETETLPVSEKHTLRGIKHIFYDNKPSSSLSLRIYASARIEPEGMLHCIPKDSISHEEAIQIDLSYPMHLLSSDHKMKKGSIPPKPVVRKELYIDPAKVQTMFHPTLS